MEELQLPAGCNKGENPFFARIVRNVLEPSECAEIISCVNRKGFTPALLNIGDGRQMLDPKARDGSRVIVDSEPLSTYLMKVLRDHLPTRMMGRDGRSLCRVEELNERCRFLSYTPGQKFEPHCDGMYVRSCEDLKADDFSRVIVQLYLHDVPEEDGGATTFIGTTDTLSCQPTQGSALLFTQDLYHEGSKLTSGLKYTMRTDVMYTDEEPDEPLTEDNVDAFLAEAEANLYPERLEWAKRKAKLVLLGGMGERIELPCGSSGMQNARVTLRPAKNAWELAQCVPPIVGLQAVLQLTGWQPKVSLQSNENDTGGGDHRHAKKRKRQDAK